MSIFSGPTDTGGKLTSSALSNPGKIGFQLKKPGTVKNAAVKKLQTKLRIQSSPVEAKLKFKKQPSTIQEENASKLDQEKK